MSDVTHILTRINSRDPHAAEQLLPLVYDELRRLAAQVLGWLYGESGHVWAEVLIDGQGWRQVDPTAGMGCDSRYIPFVATEDGRMPMVYVSQVRISPTTGKTPTGS